jgi:O-acetyl-ADP-ribose deacetylase (regulator of RNase III)
MFQKINGDITKIEADVIINAANTELKHSGGVALALILAGGSVIEKESNLIGFVPIGDFAITSCGNLKCKKIIHIPTIDYKNDKRVISYEELKNVLTKVFEYIESEGFKSVALPLLGAGIAGLEKDKVEEIIKDVSLLFNNLSIELVIKE